MIEDVNVAEEIYLADKSLEGPEFTSPPIPKLWVDALPVRDIAADDSVIFTLAVTSPGNTAGTILNPVRLIPAAGNNVRRRAMITTTSNQCALLSAPDAVQIMSANLGAILYIPSAFHLFTGEYFEYRSASALYVVSRGAAAAVSYVSVAIDQYRVRL